MLYELIIYLPAYVTLFWAVTLIATNRKKDKAQFILALFMSASFFLSLAQVAYFSEKCTAYLIFDPIYTLASLSVYPLFYWYIKLLTTEKEYNNKNLWYFFPAIVLALTSLGHYLEMTPQERKNYVNIFLFNQGIQETTSLLIKGQIVTSMVEKTVFIFSVFFTLIKGNQLINQYNKQIKNYYSKVADKSLTWLKHLMISFTIAAFF